MRILAACLLLLPAQSADPLRLPVVADAQICMAHGEERLNGGGRSTVRLKGIEDLTILDLDLTAIKGRTVEEARLFFHPAGPHKLRSIGISTIGSPWKEGGGTGSPAKPGECTYMEAAHGERPWGHPGSDLHAVTFSRGGSIWFIRELKTEADGWCSVELPAAILHAMLEGASYGMALVDESNTATNNAIYSREQNAKAPYVSVTKSKPGAPPPSGAKKYAPPAPKKVADRTADFLRKAAAPAAVAPVALADGSKLRVLYEGETNPEAAPAARIWDGRTISLSGARGEHVGFVLAIELLQPRTVRIEGDGWTASRVLPVGGTYDPLVPVAGEVSGKGLFHVERYVPKTASPGEQKSALRLKIGDAETTLPISFRVHAATLPDTLSFQSSLNMYRSPGEIAGDRAGTPGFTEMERSFHRLAHEHRTTIAIVPYSHRGNLDWAVTPEVRRTGSKVEVASWTTYDERWSPYLDGSAFKGLPRDGVPLAHMYWPMHENWPLPINDFYSYKGKIDDHWRDAPTPDQAFAEEYGKAFGAIVREFGTHAESKGWTRTQYHVFLNNKPDIRFQRKENIGAWWRLDEPVSAEDHLAIRYFAKRSFDAVKDLKKADIKFRADLSRPQCRRDYLDGVLGLDVVAGSYRQYPELVFNRGEEVWIYGGVPIGGSGEAARAWTIQCYLDGADGLLPWLALGTAQAWDKMEDTALLLPPKPGMEKRAYATLRLKGMRRGQQDVELLRLLLAKLKASREEVRGGVAQALGLLGSFQKTSEVDAGRIDYGHLDPDKFEAFRRSILEALDK